VIRLGLRNPRKKETKTVVHFLSPLGEYWPCAFSLLVSWSLYDTLSLLAFSPPCLSQLLGLPCNLAVFLTSSLSVFCSLTDFVTYPHGSCSLTDSYCVSQARSGHLRLSDHHPTNVAQPTHPSHSVCSFQSPRLTPALPSKIMTLWSNITSSLSLYWLYTQVCSRNAHSCHLIPVCHGHFSLTCSKSLILSCNPF